MILVDNGALVALFDPADGWHRRCVERLRRIAEPLCTTTPVLTEAFHLLTPSSLGAKRLMDFVDEGGLEVWT
jgi:predicted nucleic acid-binding protein